VIDVAWLTRDEREELRRALVIYRNKLERVERGRPGSVEASDCRWRLHVVRSLLQSLQPQ
jgi:hypothetical protein